MTAEEERDEIIEHAEEAYRNGEITLDELMWIRNFTAKAITLVEIH